MSRIQANQPFKSPRKYLRRLIDWTLWISFGLLIINVNRALLPRSAIESITETGAGDVVRQVVYLGIFFLSSVLYFRTASFSKTLQLIPKPLLALIVWAAITIAWSPVPDIAFRRLILTILVALIIFQLTCLAQPVLIITRLRQIIMLLSILSFIVVLIIPALGIHQPGDPESEIIGDWRGIFYHKNILGSVIAPGIIMTLYAANTTTGSQRIIYTMQVIFLSYLLYMSGSKTSFGVTIVTCLSLIILIRMARFGNGIRVIFLSSVFLSSILTVVLIYYLSISNFSNILTDESFTGRGLIWTQLLTIAENHFWTGLGFQSIFQVGLATQLGNVFGGSLFLETLSHAHNLYIEMFISIGCVGLILFIISVIIYPAIEVAKASGSDGNIRLLCFSLMLFTWLHGLLEIGIFDRDKIDWIIFLVAYGVLRQLPKGQQQ